MWCSKNKNYTLPLVLHSAFSALLKECKVCHYEIFSWREHLSSIFPFRFTIVSLGETIAQGSWVFEMEFLYSPKSITCPESKKGLGCDVTSYQVSMR